MSRAGEQPARARAGGPAGGHGHTRRASPWTVNVRSLRAVTGTRMELHAAGPIPGLAISAAHVPESAEVRFDGWAESALGGVTVSGEVRAPWSGTCRRCLEAASGELVAEVREFCRDAGKVSAEPSDEDSEYLVGPDLLDIEPIVHDACILELPLAPLCSESCAGLCPTCGANRNRDVCSCEQTVDPRWSALAGLVAGEKTPSRGTDDGRPEEEDLEGEEP